MTDAWRIDDDYEWYPINDNCADCGAEIIAPSRDGGKTFEEWQPAMCFECGNRGMIGIDDEGFAFFDPPEPK